MSTDLQTQLAEALAAGVDTTPIRARIAKAASLQRQKSAQAARVEADLLASRTQRAEILTEHLLSEALAEIEGYDDAALAAFDGGVLLADTAGLRLSAAGLAAAVIANDAAEDSLTPVRQHLSALQARLVEKQSAISAIHARRAADDERPTDAGEASLLIADIDCIRGFIGQAVAEIEAGDPAELRQQLTWHRQDFEQAKRVVLVRVASERLNRCAALFERVYNLQRQAERTAGLSASNPSGTWRASLALKNILSRH